MAKVSIPESYVVPMDQIAPGVAGLRFAFVNVFGVTIPDGSWTTTGIDKIDIRREST